MDVHLLSAAPAAPSWRLDAAEVAAAWGESGRGHVAVCAGDEDSLTLAFAAAEAALAAAGLDGVGVDGLWWGTSTPPFVDGPNLAYLAASLGVRESFEGALLAGSRISGLEAFLAAADAVATGRVTSALVVASDAVMPARGTAYERMSGAGAVAFVLGASGGSATLATRASLTRPHLDRYRGVGDDVVRDLYDPRLYREEVFLPAMGELVDRLIRDDKPIDRWSLPDPDGRLGRLLGKQIGADDVVSQSVRDLIGDAGAATALMGLAAGLTGPGRVAALDQGAGRCIGIVVEVDGAVAGTDAFASLGDRLTDASYAQVLRARGQLVADQDPIEMAVPPGGAGFVRGNVELLGLHGAKCADCGAISTPPSVHPSCIGCGGDDLSIIELARTGTVQTFVVNATMPAPFEAPLPLMVVDLADGARLLVQGTGSADGLAVGDNIELVLRRYTIERGASIYGYKAMRTPASSTSSTAGEGA